jgi:hypothetical protein
MEACDGSCFEEAYAAFNPTRSGSLEADGTPKEYWKEDRVVDALHAPTGNKEPLVVRLTSLQTRKETSKRGGVWCAREGESFSLGGRNDQLLTSSSAAGPARTSPSPASGPGSAASAAGSSGSWSASPELFGPGGFSSRTCPDSSPLARAADAASAAVFYGAIAAEAVAAVRRALPRRRRSAPTTAPTSPWSAPPWRTSAIASATGYWTHDTSEWPSDAAECSLSAVLMSLVSPKYSLSPRAASGILRRAERRGRDLPPALRGALERLAASTSPDGGPRTTSTSS